MPVLALLAGAALLGYVSLDLREPAPAPVTTPVTDPAPISHPAPVAAPVAEAVPATDPPEEPPPAPPVPAEPVPAPPPPAPPAPAEPDPAEPEAKPVTAEPVLNSLRDALASVRCAELRVEPVDGALSVTGTVTSVDDHRRVQQAVDALAGDGARPPAVAVAPAALCEPMLLLEPLRSANTARGTPLTVGTVPDDRGLAGGQDLVLDLRAPDVPVHIQVDYFTVDGGVVHLLPNPLEPVVLLDAGAARRLGERDGRTRFWTIGPPFGHELIAVVASGAPLFPAPRPEVEPAAAYLPELKRALAAPGAEGALAAALFIATRAP